MDIHCIIILVVLFHYGFLLTNNCCGLGMNNKWSLMRKYIYDAWTLKVINMYNDQTTG